jgi:hypothetical protein
MKHAPQTAGTSTTAAATGQARKTGRLSQGCEKEPKNGSRRPELRPSMRNFAAAVGILVGCGKNLEELGGGKNYIEITE